MVGHNDGGVDAERVDDLAVDQLEPDIGISLLDFLDLLGDAGFDGDVAADLLPGLLITPSGGATCNVTGAAAVSTARRAAP